MKNILNFTGFPPEAVRFYRDIEQNNTRTWFHEHHGEFQKFVMEPARAFVTEMGLRLMTVSPYIYAEPKVNRSIFRIARDARRQKKSPPYKTELALVFWETALPRLEAPSFYFALSKNSLELGGGIYRFSRETLLAYRDAVVEKKQGAELRKIAADLEKNGYKLLGKNYQRIPHSYDKHHENAKYLLHNGLYVYRENPIPKELHSAKLLDLVFSEYLKMVPLHQWLVKVSEVKKD